MRILITGNRGYIGWILTQKLLDLGHTVYGVDLGLYDDYILSYKNKGLKGCTHFTKNYKDIAVDELYRMHVETVIHLAAFSNDPMGELDKSKTYENNYIDTTEFIDVCKSAGVKHFVFSSSCSVYGMNDGDPMTEEDNTDPLTTYAKCKLLVEKYMINTADESFYCTAMRNSTVFGYSPSMRMDLVVNNLCGHAHFNKKVNILSDGTPWRPLIHVQDVANAFIHLMYFRITHAFNMYHGNPLYKFYRCVNVGFDDNILTIKEIGIMVSKSFHVPIEIGDNDPDSRSYIVDFNRFNEYTSMARKFSVNDGIDEIIVFLLDSGMNEDEFNNCARIKQLDMEMFE